jgi:hypothetical protein
MATWRQALEVVMTEEEVARLLSVSRSRTEPASRVQRAQMLLAYRENPSFFAVGRGVGVHHQTVQRCIERALAYGPLMALDDRPRPGKEPTITPEAKAWLVSLACDKARTMAIRTNYGRRVCWRATRASTGRRRDTDVSPILSKARCARFSVKRKSNRIRWGTIWNAATPSSNRGWRKFCASIARSRS